MSLHYVSRLLNTDVLNFNLTLDLLQPDCSDLVSKWRGHTVAATSCLEATAGHSQVVWRRFFVFQQDGSLAHRARDTVAFLQRDARNASSSISVVSVYEASSSSSSSSSCSFIWSWQAQLTQWMRIKQNKAVTRIFSGGGGLSRWAWAPRGIWEGMFPLSCIMCWVVLLRVVV